MSGPNRSFWAVAAEGRRVARELFREVVAVIDDLAVRGSGGVRQRFEPRWVATTFGRVRVWGYRVKRDGVSFILSIMPLGSRSRNRRKV